MKHIPTFVIALICALCIAPTFAVADESEAQVIETGDSAFVEAAQPAEAQPADETRTPTADEQTAPVTDAVDEEDVNLDQVSSDEIPDDSLTLKELEAQTQPLAAKLAPQEASVKTAATTTETATPSTSEPAAAEKTTETPALNANEQKVTEAKKTTTSTPTVLSTQAGTKVDSLAVLGNDVVYLISSALVKKDTKVLDVKSGSTKAGANVQIYDSNSTLSQYWRAEYQGNGIYRLVSYKGDHVLGVSGKLVSTANVSNIDKGTINWRVYKNSDGTYSLAPANATGLRLDVRSAKTKNGTNVWVYTSNGTKAQKFYFTQFVGLTEAYAQGKSVNTGVIEIALAHNEQLRVDIAGSAAGNSANVQLANDSKAMSQKWQVTYAGNGLYELRDANSGKMLDVSGGSMKAGANIQQYKRNQTLAQYWYVVKSGNGFQFKSAKSGLALDTKDSKAAASANVQLAKSSQKATQQYSLKYTQLVDNGTYVIQSALVMPMVLDVASGSKASGANVQLWRSNGTDAQKFKITHLGNGIYSIVGVGSGNSINVAGGSNASGANIQMAKSNSSNAQKWRIEVGDNGIMFKSVQSGKYMDVKSGRVNKGTNIWQYNGNKTLAQAWVLHDENWTFYDKSTSVAALRYISKAEEYDGWRYRWGGRSPSTSFDCAGLVMYCANATLGTKYDLMMTNAEKLYSLCTPIKASEARPGDLVFYRGTYNSINYISHVVIYVGKGIMYGAGDPIGYQRVDAIKNMRGNQATYMYARIKR